MRGPKPYTPVADCCDTHGGADKGRPSAASPEASPRRGPPSRLLAAAERAFDRLLDCMAALACVILSLVTLSVCLEVILRYLFNRPQVWVIELSEYALLYITFLGAAWVLRKEGHVSVDLFINILSRRGRTVCSLFSYTICFTVSVVLILYGLRVTIDYFSKGIYNPTILEIPTAYILAVIPLGGLTLLIQSFRGAFQHFQELRGAGSESKDRCSAP